LTVKHFEPAAEFCRLKVWRLFRTTGIWLRRRFAIALIASRRQVGKPVSLICGGLKSAPVFLQCVRFPALADGDHERGFLAAKP
jgi:hypothetical protein